MKKRITHRISGKTFFAALTFFGLSIGAANAQECSIGSITYPTLDAALAAITDATPTTIKLLTDITHNGGCTIRSRVIIFDLNGKDLIFNGTTTAALTLDDGWINYINAGNLKVISTGNDGLNISYGSCKLTYAETSKSAGGSNAVFCWNGGKVTVTGSVKTSGNNGGVTADGTNSSVTVNGDITSGGNGVGATAGGTVTVTGTITAADNGIFAGNGTNSKVIVTGNITASGYGIGISYTCTGTIVTVTGDITSNGSGKSGIFTQSSAQVTVNGNVKATGSNGLGIAASGGTVTHITGNVISNSGVGVDVSGAGTTVTIDGFINATPYIKLNGVVKIAADGVTDATKPDYLKYADATSTVWVGNKPSGIENVELQSLKIYPNPVKDELRIKNDELRIKNVEIVDLSGRAVLMGEFNSPLQNGNPVGAYCIRPNETTINVSSLPQGIYFVKITTDKGVVTRKFVKE